MFFSKRKKFVLLLLTSAFFSCAFAKNKEAYVTLNSENGCKVRVGAWLSPSCTHCAEYFQSVLPKILKKPGFCIDFHSLPHLYLLDMPVAVLVWSQGTDKAFKNAGLFYKKQDEWLLPSVEKSDINDSSRINDVKKFITSIENEFSASTVRRISEYISPTDPYLYVKIFALKNGFSIDHLERYLPNGSVDSEISRILVKDLPRMDSEKQPNEKTVVKYSPAFTSTSGELLPDEVLDGKILTEDSADKMLEKAVDLKPAPKNEPSLDDFPYKAKETKNIEENEEDSEIQYADEDGLSEEEDNVDDMPEKLKALLNQISEDSEVE